MKKNLTQIIPFTFLIFLLSACAGKYSLIQPQNSSYVGRDTGQLQLAYKYGVLQSAGNKKYVKKELKNNISLVALKITNNTNRPVEFEKDFIILADNNEIEVLSTVTTYNQLKQGVPIYLLYLLLTPGQLTKTETTSSGISKTENIFPLGLILGPGLAAGNMIAASTANTNFKKELEDYSIFNKSIGAGETAHVIIAIRESGFRPLRIKKLK